MRVEEQDLNIVLRNGQTSFGTLWELGSSSPLMLMFHGFPADRISTPFPALATAFADMGLSTYRPDFYGPANEARNLLDCTVDLHAEDIEDITSHLRRAFPKRTLIGLGHSMGGLSLIATRAQFDGVVLLDPSHPLAFPYSRSEALAGTIKELFVWHASLGCYETEGIQTLLSKEFLASIIRDSEAEITRITAPLLIAFAENGILQETSKKYFDAAESKSKTLVGVPGADHCFAEYGAANRVVEQVVNWMQLLHTAHD